MKVRRQKNVIPRSTSLARARAEKMFKVQTNTVFYPTALMGCRGIVFTHGVRIGGCWAGGKKFVRPVSQKP